MHLPSGLIDGHVEAMTAVAAAGGLTVAARAVRSGADHRCTPARVAAVAGVVFAAQLLNVPVGDGVSGHLLGAAAAVALLGWAGGVLAVALVVAVQAAVFGDGDLSTLGANLLHLAVVPGLVAATVLRRGSERWRLAVAGSASLLAGVLTVGLELAAGAPTGGGTMAVDVVLAHLPVAALEAAATVVLVALLARHLDHPRVVAVGLLAGVAVSPWAASAPDGLERVAIDHGLGSALAAGGGASLLDGYALGPGAPGVVAAALIGLALVVGLARVAGSRLAVRPG